MLQIKNLFVQIALGNIALQNRNTDCYRYS